MDPQAADALFGTPPILLEANDVTAGYYQLERLEREFGTRTLVEHRDEVGIWYRLLTLHAEALLRESILEGSITARRGQTLRSQLLGLGLTTSKAALDMLIVGYYSIAYGAIRHMIESWSFSRLVEVWPNEAEAFLSPTFSDGRAKKPIRMQELIAKMRKQSRDQRDRDLFDRAYDGWKGMSAGSHPSGIGLLQTLGDGPGKGVLGAAYNPDLWDAGIRNGLTAAFLLVHETGRITPQSPEWEQEVVDLGVLAMSNLNPESLESYVRQYGNRPNESQ